MSFVAGYVTVFHTLFVIPSETPEMSAVTLRSATGFSSLTIRESVLGRQQICGADVPCQPLMLRALDSLAWFTKYLVYRGSCLGCH
jgi:hypothetical protein